jgi:hypothetical protein
MKFIGTEETMSNTNGQMTKAVRSEICMLLRKREKMLKSVADEYGAKRMAECEAQIAAECSFDQDEVWRPRMPSERHSSTSVIKKSGELCRMPFARSKSFR